MRISGSAVALAYAIATVRSTKTLLLVVAHTSLAGRKGNAKEKETSGYTRSSTLPSSMECESWKKGHRGHLKSISSE